ncbi:GNAT family N-acetyltransferase [Paenibacillus glacialis]|uniref:GCN5 family acetyltransferase n=1 Tax=Paenibacillus glacialis TaxID=494026 RepID=A0A168GBB5_9BACL|nr:GNAT family N-acetyltransferase [Paenibacillus glacialis]OAB37002.1 GCN5 family acetyltransferase [Paenibacillus glacialis]
MKELNETILIDVYPATIEESHKVLELWKESARWIQSKGINQWNPDHFNIEQVHECFNNGSEIFLARLNEEVVGTLFVCWSDPIIWEELDDNASGYIHRFAVSRNHLGLGIGKKLLIWSENYIRNKGKKRIRLDCMAENNSLNQYYLESGYKHIKLLQWHNGWKINLYEKN